MSLSGKQIKDTVLTALVNKNKTWVSDLRDYIVSNISTNVEVTGEDIRILATEAGITPSHPNGWGAGINSLIKSGNLIPTDYYTSAEIKSSHASRRRIYICNAS